ncbi:O-antigen ligase family protein [Paenibacillus sp. HJGM_3]|uniref:O-antigen ligase family protein n=1 Tax=Paenibacillus sp. HJGM_3 TaxID=3379816 RepID=UPI00385F15A2
MKIVKYLSFIALSIVTVDFHAYFSLFELFLIGYAFISLDLNKKIERLNIYIILILLLNIIYLIGWCIFSQQIRMDLIRDTYVCISIMLLFFSKLNSRDIVTAIIIASVGEIVSSFLVYHEITKFIIVPLIFLILLIKDSFTFIVSSMIYSLVSLIINAKTGLLLAVNGVINRFREMSINYKALLIAASLVFAVSYSDQIVAVTKKLNVTSGEASTKERYMLLTVGWANFESNPVFGTGPNSYQEYLSKKAKNEDQKQRYHTLEPHNFFLELLSERGIIGLVLWLFPFCVFWVHRKKMDRRFIYLLISFFIVLFLGLLDQYLRFVLVLVISYGMQVLNQKEDHLRRLTE